MMKIKYSLFFALLFFVVTARAQQDHAFQVTRTYQIAMDLLDKQKFTAAAQQFREGTEAKYNTSNQPDFETRFTTLQENAQYYIALCALELGNDDAESLFLKFIKEHPENPLTKLAYFQMGKFASKQEKYTEAITWFDKIDAGEISGADKTEYKFRKGYA